MVEIVIILKKTHQAGDSSLHGSLINNACGGNAVLGKADLDIVDHDRHVSSLDNGFILPFSGQIALHLPVHNSPGSNGVVLPPGKLAACGNSRGCLSGRGRGLYIRCRRIA